MIATDNSKRSKQDEFTEFTKNTLSTVSFIGLAYGEPSSRKYYFKEAQLLDNTTRGILDAPIVKELPIEKLPSAFTGDNRRLASDRLIELYPDNKEKAVESVLKAIKPPGQDSYRNNIYVARTLAQIPGGWEGSEDQKKRLRV